MPAEAKTNSKLITLSSFSLLMSNHIELTLSFVFDTDQAVRGSGRFHFEVVPTAAESPSAKVHFRMQLLDASVFSNGLSCAIGRD